MGGLITPVHVFCGLFNGSHIAMKSQVNTCVINQIDQSTVLVSVFKPTCTTSVVLNFKFGQLPSRDNLIAQ